MRNTLAITELLGHPEVKVYQGLPHSSTTDSFTVGEISAFVHGVNGIGDVEIPNSSRAPETESASSSAKDRRVIVGSIRQRQRKEML